MTLDIYKDVGFQKWYEQSEKEQQRWFKMLGDHCSDYLTYKDIKPLQLKIGFAIFGYPQYDANTSQYFYNKDQVEHIMKILNQIHNTSKEFDEHGIYLSTLFIYCYLIETKDENAEHLDVMFKIRSKTSIHGKFVDSNARVYDSWQNFKTKNIYPKCWYLLPKNGNYHSNSEGGVLLEIEKSPACSLLNKVGSVLDTGSLLVGVGGAAVAITSVFFPLAASLTLGAVITGGVGGLYSFSRSVNTLIDRHTHRQSISLKDSEARSAWVDLTLSALTVGMSAGSVYSALASTASKVTSAASASGEAVASASTATKGGQVVAKASKSSRAAAKVASNGSKTANVGSKVASAAKSGTRVGKSASSVGKGAVKVAAKAAKITKTASSVNNIASKASNIATNIGKNTAKATKAAADIGKNTAKATKVATDIGKNTAKATKAAADIGKNTAKATKVAVDIGKNTAKAAADIGKNTGNAANLASKTAKATKVVQHAGKTIKATEVVANAGQKTAYIAKNTVDVGRNSVDITQNVVRSSSVLGPLTSFFNSSSYVTSELMNSANYIFDESTSLQQNPVFHPLINFALKAIVEIAYDILPSDVSLKFKELIRETLIILEKYNNDSIAEEDLTNFLTFVNFYFNTSITDAKAFMHKFVIELNQSVNNIISSNKRQVTVYTDPSQINCFKTSTNGNEIITATFAALEHAKIDWSKSDSLQSILYIVTEETNQQSLTIMEESDDEEGYFYDSSNNDLEIANTDDESWDTMSDSEDTE